MRIMIGLIALLVMSIQPGATLAATKGHRSAEECRRLVDQRMSRGNGQERAAARARCRAGGPI
jgi:hypothetical protein